MKKLEIIEEISGEIAHHYEPDSETVIVSKANVVWGKIDGRDFKVSLPISFFDGLLSTLRILRRLSRRDKSNVVLNADRSGLIIVYLGKVFFYDLQMRELKFCVQLRTCRNLLHQSIYIGQHGILFGEYGANEKREAVPIWRSDDGGRGWSVDFEFPAGSIKHVHGIYEDPYSSDLWVSTGDRNGECGVYRIIEGSFQNIQKYGDGSQLWRPVSFWFLHDKILWGMDSNIEQNFINMINRDGTGFKQILAVSGPVWYNKCFSDGSTVLQTTVEIGDGSKCRGAEILYSEDSEKWQKLALYQKDWWPMRLFKFGVIGFADGPQSSSDFLFFGEALKGCDGKIFRARIVSGDL